ncbi:hypothetical protein FD755_010194 [Muntiacus reevesi]|uniref:G-protein coupled receptors family 1 profile domain-containing protein n=1 Tax=Muntiacus reevesi TaxID=9886 RepID=A0A5N3Y139_MUNRE|nr:hypothetical protein FD755_010194 [Muntiacus reevesi]
MLSVIGNLAILILTLVDSHLKTVMYFFCQIFSFLKISFTSACIPRFLYSISSGDRTITYNACVCQLFFTDLFGITEFFLLAAMSYSHYVATCKPLHYMTIMNHRVCKRLIFCCWMTTVLIMIPPFSLKPSLEFCDSNVLDRFFCDAKPVLKITCSDTQFMEKMVIICSALILIMTLVFIPLCPAMEKGIFLLFFPHDCVSITYGSCIFIYIKNSAKDEMEINKGVSILMTSISPMLNPFTYTP